MAEVAKVHRRCWNGELGSELYLCPRMIGDGQTPGWWSACTGKRKEFRNETVSAPKCTTVGFAFSLSPVAPDGKPNLSAPTPRTANGKPDFSGLEEMERKDLIGEGTSGSGFGYEPISQGFYRFNHRDNAPQVGLDKG